MDESFCQDLRGDLKAQVRKCNANKLKSGIGRKKEWVSKECLQCLQMLAGCLGTDPWLCSAFPRVAWQKKHGTCWALNVAALICIPDQDLPRDEQWGFRHPYKRWTTLPLPYTYLGLVPASKDLVLMGEVSLSDSLTSVVYTIYWCPLACSSFGAWPPHRQARLTEPANQQSRAIIKVKLSTSHASSWGILDSSGGFCGKVRAFHEVGGRWAGHPKQFVVMKLDQCLTWATAQLYISLCY